MAKTAFKAMNMLSKLDDKLGALEGDKDKKKKKEVVEND